MAKLIQDHRSVKVYSVLADNTLLFSAMRGVEALSTLFEYRLELISEDHELELNDLLGTDISVCVELETGGERYFHGYISDCSHLSSGDQYAYYEFTVRPWLWFLSRTADCKIFQEISVVDIIKKVFREHGFTDFNDKLTGSYKKQVYCVQYRETDLSFVSRLMEQSGIYYYFTHERGKHTLVLSDDYSAHSVVSNYANVPYYPAGEDNPRRERDHLYRWHLQKKLQPGAYATTDFDFEKPKSSLLAKSTGKGEHARSDYEVFDYPGSYTAKADGDKVARRKLEEIAIGREIAHGTGTAAGLAAGHLFSLTDSERADQNREYLIVRSEIEIALNDYRSGGDDSRDCQIEVQAIVSRQPFRAPCVTPRPVVQGPQSAIVVGPKAEEIWTDKYGRIKLQFRWDRYGKSDENSSCWIRVAHATAGQKWGAIHTPRIGQEVIVEFLEGDPDHPIVTGGVYNGDNGVPYDLPKNATQSGFKSHSSKDGSKDNFNEIRMEDKKGEEELYIHAERDMNMVVENNASIKVGLDKKDKGDYTLEIENDRTTTIESGNDALTVKKGNRETDISKGNYNINVKAGNMTTKISAGKATIQAMKAIELKVGGNSIVIDQKGVTIKGIMVTVQGQAKADVKSPLTTVSGDGMLTLKGGVTMIN